MREERTLDNYSIKFNDWLKPLENVSEEERLETLQEKRRFKEISKKNSDLLIECLLDFYEGLFTKNKKRISPVRLSNIKVRIIWILKQFEERAEEHKDILTISPKAVNRLFNDMEDGIIRKNNGQMYRSPLDYSKVFKTFWHWLQRKRASENIIIPDVTMTLNCQNKEKAPFVYLDEKDIKKLIANLPKQKHRVMAWLVFDSGIRSPKEILNVKVEDLFEEDGFYKLDIKVPKKQSFQRIIKLMLCKEIIKEYIMTENLQPQDYLFKKTTAMSCNVALKRKAVELFGDVMTKGRARISALRLYDLRHCSACYWISRYNNQQAMMYRFGWKRQEMILYYTELLGLADTIQEDDLLIDTQKTQLEQKVEKLTKENELIKDKLDSLIEPERIEQLKDLNSLLKNPEIKELIRISKMKREVIITS